MSGPTTIVVAHASVGSGHRIAAESIAAELTSLLPDATVEIVDVLEHGALRISGNTATGAFTGPTAPLYGAVWGSTAVGSVSMAFARPLLGLIYRGFTRLLEDRQPSVVVTTHALAANLAARATRQGLLSRVPVVAVATDYGLHGYWPRRGLALFCVADDAERDELLRRRVPESDVAVTGIPVRPQFAEAQNREAARVRFGLPADKRVVLALAGATQPRPYVKFKASLAVTLPAIAALPSTTVVVVTGRDMAFAEELRSRVAGFGAKNVVVLGFVEEMAHVMAASDLGVCKPGGLMTAECASVHLPMILVGPSVGQERANVTSLTRSGAAVYDDDPRRLTEVVRKTLGRRGKLEQMRHAAAAIARPHAAHAVAERVVTLLHS